MKRRKIVNRLWNDKMLKGLRVDLRVIRETALPAQTVRQRTAFDIEDKLLECTEDIEIVKLVRSWAINVSLECSQEPQR